MTTHALSTRTTSSASDESLRLPTDAVSRVASGPASRTGDEHTPEQRHRASHVMELVVGLAVVPALLVVGIVLAAPELGLSTRQLLVGSPLACLFWLALSAMVVRSLVARRRSQLGAEDFSWTSRTREALVVVAEGQGGDEVLELLTGAATTPGRSLVVLRAENLAGIRSLAAIQALCRAKDVRLATFVGPHEQGWAPRSASRLVQLAPWIADADLYVCGSSPWVSRVVAEVTGYGVHPSQVHVENLV